MKTNHPITKLSGGLIASVLVVGFLGQAQAQLNEKRIERDATGVYQGTMSGGRYSRNYTDPSYTDFSDDLHPAAGKARVPVKDGKLSSIVKDSDLPGNDTAKCSGVERRSDVKRGGKAVGIKYTGSVNLDEGTYANWTNGMFAGDLNDRGAKWQGRTKGSAQQNNSTQSPAHKNKLAGLVFKGRG